MVIHNSQEKSHLSTNDARLLDEALSRLQKVRGNLIIDRDKLLSILDAELQRGRRDMFGLLKAGQRTLDGLFR